MNSEITEPKEGLGMEQTERNLPTAGNFRGDSGIMDLTRSDSVYRVQLASINRGFFLRQAHNLLAINLQLKIPPRVTELYRSLKTLDC
jgi:hypothetical protein